MKKTLLWLAAVFAVMIFAGCDPEPGGGGEEQQLKLTITGISAATSTITQASLMGAWTGDGYGGAPKAVAYDNSGNGEFSFLILIFQGQPKDPYTTPGSYCITIQDNSTPDNAWRYVGPDTGAQTPITCPFPATTTLPFEHFYKYK